jgi:hypothetical protein
MAITPTPTQRGGDDDETHESEALVLRGGGPFGEERYRIPVFN